MALHADGNQVYLLWTYVPTGGGGEIYGVKITDVPTGIAVGRFAGEAVDDRVVLRWWVSDGRDVTGFRVHRAEGAAGFAAVGEVAASGASEYQWEDLSVAAGTRYRYRLEVARTTGPPLWEGPVEVAVESRSRVLRWRDAVPNPFAEGVELGLESEALVATRVRVFDVAGHVVAELRPQMRDGHAWVRWDGRDPSGRRLAPGLYLVRAEAGARHATRRVVCMR
jgi:hypothetical protein